MRQLVRTYLEWLIKLYSKAYVSLRPYKKFRISTDKLQMKMLEKLLAISESVQNTSTAIPTEVREWMQTIQKKK